jgi:hypothetical protein
VINVTCNEALLLLDLLNPFWKIHLFRPQPQEEVKMKNNLTKPYILLTTLIIIMIVSSCGTSPAQSVVTEQPSDVPPTILPSATSTPAPTATATETPLPTSTSTPTGPFVFKDDFSAKTDAWGKCDVCEWKGEKLFFGPVPPKGQGIDQLFWVICEACGEREFFRISADVTWESGQVDRDFGLVGIIPDKFLVGMGITPLQHGIIETFDFVTGTWGGNFSKYGAVKPARATNHIEFAVKPGSNGNADWYATVNGKNIVVNYNQTVQPYQAALYLGWHSVGVSYDNFEYEELVP